jgi:Rhodanese-like domain
MSTYASPDSLVETAWLAEHLNDADIRIVESNEDILLYGSGHIPNAVHIDWRADLNDPVQRDYIAPEAFAKLAARNGVSPETTVIFYGDKANWWAAYALWVFRLFGHDKVKLLNGDWTLRSAPSKRRHWSKATLASRSSTCVRRANSRGTSRTCPNTLRKACSGAGISPARVAFPGKPPPMTMERLSQLRNCAKSMLETWAWTR